MLCARNLTVDQSLGFTECWHGSLQVCFQVTLQSTDLIGHSGHPATMSILSIC